MMAAVGDILVKQVSERLEVTNAPERGSVSLSLLFNAGNGFRLDHDVLWIGYPMEEEVGYRIVGFDLDSMFFQVEKL